ncbi:ciliary microtubule inner protein 6 [Carettochelys insculpta]|uniref:ciliary microtubule inner protein 6 n=1 Tax=Carettochelys insculpta TaxID=44489 RepID=UPI003EB90445
MRQIPEDSIRRRKKVPPYGLPNTYRIFNIDTPEVSLRIEKVNGECMPKMSKNSFQHSNLPEWRNNPQPRYAKLINTNVRLLNEPICYMETEDTMAKQHHWWPNGEPCVYRYSPPYDRQSTQRNDFRKPTCALSSPTKYSSKLQPSCGIVPLATPRTSTCLPKILQERTSFIHQYNARKSPNEPIRGKRHGAFVWTEIKPVSGPMVPKGTEVFLSARGSCSLEQPKTEKGNSVESQMTSPSFCLKNSQETLDCETHLSKPDVREAAKAYPRIPVRGQKSSSISQATEVDVIHSAGEESLCPAIKDPLNKPLDKLPPAHKNVQSLISPTATKMERA